MVFDRVLIEQSIAKQYGVLPSDQGELHYGDWAKLVAGLMEDTPLGRVVQVRMEKDGEVLRRMTPQQKQLRAEWAQFTRKRREPHYEEDIGRLEAMMAALFGKGGGA